MSVARTRLGPLDAFADLPAPIDIGPRRFFLVRDGSRFTLLSNVCPHQGGAVYDEGSRFECPLHGWRFERTTGRCINAPSRGLTSVPVSIEDGVLYAAVAGDEPVERVTVQRSAAAGMTIQLHAHACLEISHEGFTLLTDPWLDGPAFLGAWTQYPPPLVSASDLHPDAIVITHEHSDHFHEATLARFDRATPIYVPDFPNQRLPRRLAALGFGRVVPIRFGERTAIHDGWHLTAYEPQSYWNDAFFLLEAAGLRLFNANDAGVNARIAPLVAPIDILAIQFSAGASGYPWTWSHLSDGQKAEISTRACAGKLELVREAARLYGASAVLPFASHFSLWHATHRDYARLSRRNTLADVKAALSGSGAEVIDLLPGEQWNVGAGTIVRRGDRGDLFQPQQIADHLDRAVPPATFAAFHPDDESVTRCELVDYLEQLNAVPEIVHCEDLTVSMASDRRDDDRMDVAFEIRDGRMRLLEAAPALPNLTITIPRAVLTAVIRGGLSWDEAFIGYWCRFDRHPNVYHAGFWRLFQAPYYRRPSLADSRGSAAAIGAGSTVADVLERHGVEADRIMRRYGLYCSGCAHSTGESIAMAARQHGIDGHRLDLLVRELASACEPR